MLNQIQIIGRLGQNAELRYTPNGSAVTNFSVATSQTWKDKEGKKQEKTQWFRVTLWGKIAEAIAQYLQKGTLVYCGGRMESHDYDDKDGNKKTGWEVVAHEVKLLGGGKARHTGRAATGEEPDVAGFGEEEEPEQAEEEQEDAGLPF